MKKYVLRNINYLCFNVVDILASIVNDDILSDELPKPKSGNKKKNKNKKKDLEWNNESKGKMFFILFKKEF